MGDDRMERWSVALEERVAADLAATPIPFVGDGSRPVWSIDTPPPYPSGRWHIGAVAGYSLIDMIARSRRMLGHDVLFPWGVDRNGINIEFAIEKKHGKRMQAWAEELGAVAGRQAFVDACEAAISEFSDDMVRIGQRIGLSCDFARGYATDSPDYRAFSQACFLDLFERGLIVEDLRPNTFDPKLGTSIADAEVYYEERKTRLHHIRWTARDAGVGARGGAKAGRSGDDAASGAGEAIVISTTRPELIPACRAVLVHPDNEATKHLVGKVAVLPIDRAGTTKDAPGGPLPDEVPILAHPHVKTDFGSGIMMVCSFGDQADVQLFRELSLEPIAAIGMDGRMTAAAGPYRGLKVEEARTKVVEDLAAAGRVEGHDEVDQKFPISERSKAPVEIILLKEWYVRQTDCLGDLRRVANEMRFVPPKHRQLLLDWIDSVSIDWPVSRRRWYHTEIPLWFVLDGSGDETEYVIVPHAGALEPVDGAASTGAGHGESAQAARARDGDAATATGTATPPGAAGATRARGAAGTPTYHRPWAEDPGADARVLHRTTRADEGSLQEFLAARPGWSWRGETKVFDTWMDSSVSNLYILKDHAHKPWSEDHVCSVRPQGRDIVRTWLYYTLLKSWLLHERPAFQTAWIHGLGMDKHGRKMSKSLGNVIDPDTILHKYGSDAFRLWIAGECTIGDDFRIDEQRIQGTGKFLQKLASVVSFVRRFEAPAERPATLHPADDWILGELDEVTRKGVAGYEALDLFTPANAVRSFVWNLFAPHYVEMVKGRAYEGDAAACWTLHEAVRRVLLLLAPVAPFVTHHLASEAYGLDVHRARLPESSGAAADAALTEAVVAFNSEVWRRKKAQGVSLAAPIDGIAIPDTLAPLTDVLREMHSLDKAPAPRAAE